MSLIQGYMEVPNSFPEHPKLFLEFPIKHCVEVCVLDKSEEFKTEKMNIHKKEGNVGVKRGAMIVSGDGLNGGGHVRLGWKLTLCL